jgi:hypothetical protein
VTAVDGLECAHGGIYAPRRQRRKLYFEGLGSPGAGTEAGTPELGREKAQEAQTGGAAEDAELASQAHHDRDAPNRSLASRTVVAEGVLLQKPLKRLGLRAELGHPHECGC